MSARTIVGLLLVAVIGIFCVGYTPTNLGGSTTYVSTYGTSMRPRFHAGDLAVVQPAREYHVGEIVAYRSSTLHNATVLHRIVAIDHGRFTFKGDNNNFLDPTRPTADQIVGRLRFRIAHGGAIRSFVARPFVLFPLLALAIGGAASGFFTRKRRRRSGSHRRQPARPPRAPGDRRLRVVVPIAAAVAAAGFLVAAAAMWTSPRTEVTTRRVSYAQHLTVGYHAPAAKGAAYPDGSVDTGDPIFTRLVQRVNIGLDYNLHADVPPQQVRGTYQVMADVSSVTGWSQSIPLTPMRSFAGNHFTAHAPLQLALLRALETRFSDETGLVTTQATVTIEPRVRTSGRIADTRFSGGATAKLEFQLSPDSMTTAAPGTADADTADTTHTGSVTVATTRAADATFWKLTMPVDAARVALFVAFAGALAAAAAILAIDRRRVALGELDAIQRRYGRLLIAVDTIPDARGRTPVRVESMRALAQLAQVNEQPIVHSDRPGGHRFALATDTVVYHYDAAPRQHRTARIAPAAAPA